MNKDLISESQLVEKVVCFLTKQDYEIELEIPSMGRHIDLVAVKQGLITAIEAKISNKKRVLEQCVHHDIVADFICIAWGAKNVASSLFHEADKRGYGIIHCPPHSRCSWVLQPVKNEKLWESQKRVLINSWRTIAER